MKLGCGTCHFIFYFVSFQTFFHHCSRFLSSILHHLLLHFFQVSPRQYLPSCTASFSPMLSLSGSPAYISDSVCPSSVLPSLKHLALIMKMTAGLVFCSPFYRLFTHPRCSSRQWTRSYANICMQAGTLKTCRYGTQRRHRLYFSDQIFIKEPVFLSQSQNR